MLLIAKLIISVPQLLKLFIKLQNEIAKNFKDARFDRNRQRIDDWVRNPDGDTGKSSSRVSESSGGSTRKPPIVD